MGKRSSQDLCASSDSLDNESYGRRGDDIKSDSFLFHPKNSINPSQSEINQTMIQYPYDYVDPFHGALFTLYAPHSMIQPDVMGPASSRVPLPFNFSDDGPIYVNAKQYHGILRRRQVRAKLEAQNKLVKSRKPYLHESRHMHALKRVRGSGGRFLSNKKSQHSNSYSPTNYHTILESHRFNQNEDGLNEDMLRFDVHKPNAHHISEGMSITSSTTIFQHPVEGRFSSMPASMQGSGGLVYSGNRHYASIVR